MYHPEPFHKRLLLHLGMFCFNNALFNLVAGGFHIYFLTLITQRHWGLLNGYPFNPFLKLLLSIFALDFIEYWTHRLVHQNSIFWRIHWVHHSDSVVDITTGLRDSPFQLFLNWIFKLIACACFGISLLELAIYNTLVLLTSLFHHMSFSTFHIFLKPLEKFLITPNLHRYHHRFPKHLANCNYGALFSIWDRVFGTFFNADTVPRIKSSYPAMLVVAALLLGACEPIAKPPSSSHFLAEAAYGKQLIVNTARLLGPSGSVASITGTRMNCTNCHLLAGEKEFGISFRNTFTRYPEYQARTGKLVTLMDRINNCFERPMNGQPLELTSREMKALLAYYRLLAFGKEVGSEAWGDSINTFVQFPDRAADPQKGAVLYSNKCSTCHGNNGEGKLSSDNKDFIYPPLWGPESYNEASNMFRNIKLATFLRANMPLGATAKSPLLTTEEAFDLASFINDRASHPRPRTKWKDYLNINEKPLDYPVGPYADEFSENQHRLGPYPVMIDSLKKRGQPIFY